MKKPIGKPIRKVCPFIILICLLIGYLCLRGQEKEQSDVSVQTEEENVGNGENTENKKTAESVESTEDKEIAESVESAEDKEPAKSVNSAELKQYYGVYEIAEFWPTLYFFRGHRFDKIREQEADMMIGHFVEIQEDSLVTYECFRWEGVYDGKSTRIENYQIEKVSIENPAYEWESRDPALTSLEEFAGRLRDSFPCAPEFENCREKIRGRITVTVEAPYLQEYYVMEDGIMMYSTMTNEYFYLKKLDKKPDKVLTAEALSEEEKEKIRQDVYGNYTIIEFMPTKFYPALDVAGDALLPQEEADMMIGREIVIDDQLFTTYDNGRLPNSEAANRSMEEYLLEKIEITTPDYQIERKLRDDIFGLRDDMLPEEMQQEEYIEINVYPGYGESIFDSLLPQMYQLNDGRLLLYAMGEYFLLEKKEAVPEPFVYRNLLEETNLRDIEQEIAEYRTNFIELYTSTAMEETESQINIEEMETDFGDNGEPATLIKYTDSSGEVLRYQLQFYGETGQCSIDYYLCKDFVLISRKNDYYSSWVLTAGYSDVLYSTIENWIITDEDACILHSNGELEKIEKTQLEVPMLEEIEKFAQTEEK